MILKIDSVSKKAKKDILINNLSAEFVPGIYGILGGEFSGKTALANIISGLSYPDSGTVVFDDGEKIGNISEMKCCTGYASGKYGYYENFTVYEFLKYVAVLKGVSKKKIKEKINEIIYKTDLVEHSHKLIYKLSAYAKRCLGIAQAIINNPKVLIFDNPTSGLNNEEKVRIRNIIPEISCDKIVIIFTEIVSDIEYLAEKIYFMEKGKIFLKGTKEDITRLSEGHVWKCLTGEDMIDFYERRYKVSYKRSTHDFYELRVVAEDKPDSYAVLTEPDFYDSCLYFFSGDKIEFN